MGPGRVRWDIIWQTKRVTRITPHYGSRFNVALPRSCMIGPESCGIFVNSADGLKKRRARRILPLRICSRIDTCFCTLPRIVGCLEWPGVASGSIFSSWWAVTFPADRRMCYVVNKMSSSITQSHSHSGSSPACCSWLLLFRSTTSGLIIP